MKSLSDHLIDGEKIQFLDDIEAVTEAAAIDAIALFGLEDAKHSRLAINLRRSRFSRGAGLAHRTAQVGRASEPMLLSGIALAGANREVADAGNEGLLFALEAEGLNLDGTEVVVLSACDTARGDVDYSEGVFGLAARCAPRAPPTCR